MDAELDDLGTRTAGAFEHVADLREMRQLQGDARRTLRRKLNQSRQAIVPSDRRSVAKNNLDHRMVAAGGDQFRDRACGEYAPMIDQDRALTGTLHLFHIVRAVD